MPLDPGGSDTDIIQAVGSYTSKTIEGTGNALGLTFEGFGFTYEATPAPSNPSIGGLGNGDFLHVVRPTTSTNWQVTFDATKLQYIGVNPIATPGVDGWLFEVINASGFDTLNFRAVPGLPVDRKVTVQFGLSVLVATGSLSNLITGIGSSDTIDPEIP